MKTTPWFRSPLRPTDRPAAATSVDAGDDRWAEPQFAVAVARWIA